MNPFYWRLFHIPANSIYNNDSVDSISDIIQLNTLACVMTGNLVTLSLSKSLQNPSCLYSDMNNQGKYHIETCSLQSNGFTQKNPLVFIQWWQMWHITWWSLLRLLALSFSKTCIVGLLIHSILR